ncbi:MAG: hypothetical protein U1F52_16395 [Burkholderiales bacterium]
MQHPLTRIALSTLLALPLCAAAQNKDERAGNCADAKKQMDYFCNEQNSANDSMVAIGTACTNAKKNVAAACEGKVEEDKVYKFDK